MANNFLFGCCLPKTFFVCQTLSLFAKHFSVWQTLHFVWQTINYLPNCLTFSNYLANFKVYPYYLANSMHFFSVVCPGCFHPSRHHCWWARSSSPTTFNELAGVPRRPIVPVPPVTVHPPFRPRVVLAASQEDPYDPRIVTGGGDEQPGAAADDFWCALSPSSHPTSHSDA